MGTSPDDERLGQQHQPGAAAVASFVLGFIGSFWGTCVKNLHDIYARIAI